MNVSCLDDALLMLSVVNGQAEVLVVFLESADMDLPLMQVGENDDLLVQEPVLVFVNRWEIIEVLVHQVNDLVGPPAQVGERDHY